MYLNLRHSSASALQDILREAIESVVDRTALTDEINAEKQDSQFLAGVRRTVRKMLIETIDDIEFDDEEGDDE